MPQIILYSFVSTGHNKNCFYSTILDISIKQIVECSGKACEHLGSSPHTPCVLQPPVCLLAAKYFVAPGKNYGHWLQNVHGLWPQPTKNFYFFEFIFVACGHK